MTCSQEIPASHAPGPWIARKSHDGRIEADVHTEIGQFVADCGTHEWSDANASLIAAAPELLASLKELSDWVAGGLQASDEAWPDEKCLQYTEELAARARAAVDKAEGRK